ncbi:MAG: TetR/AcrR family transcriptional regulator [Alphaproteobacteria bacterium]|nr:TetR/AcrR family transcriptional regulator [Alphaproteobacteria bacterium]
MSPRRYHAPKRQSVTERTRRRIVDAVIKLHAQQGVTRTTYAMIAKRADVAIPTVYNHFPTMGDLLAACSGDVLTGAPPLGPPIFADVPDLDGRLRALARSLCAYYRYVAPWLRWSSHEAVLVPDIAARLERMADARRQLVRLALEPAFGPRPPAPLMALSEILLDFQAWQRLARDNDVAGDAVEIALAQALLALARDHLAAAATDPAGESIALQRGRKPT